LNDILVVGYFEHVITLMWWIASGRYL